MTMAGRRKTTEAAYSAMCTYSCKIGKIKLTSSDVFFYPGGRRTWLRSALTWLQVVKSVHSDPRPPDLAYQSPVELHCF